MAVLKRLKRDTESGKITSSDTAKLRWPRRTMLIGATAFVFVIVAITVAAFDLGNSGRAPIKSTLSSAAD